RGELNFSFVWQNPSDRFALANVDGYLILSGFCQAGSDGGFFPGDRQSSLTIDVRLDILETWNQPPTSPLPQFGQSQNAITLKTDTGGFGDPGAIEFTNLFRGYDLRYELFIVEPNGIAVFNTTVAVSFGNSDGTIIADFSNGELHVMSPFVLVAVVS